MDEAWPYFKDVLASDIVYLSDTASIATMNQCPQQTTRWSTSMKPLLILTLGVALAVGACGAPTSDTTDAASEGLDTSTGVADTSLDITSSVDTETPPSSENTAAPAQPVYLEVTIPSGTTLPLTLTSSVASDTSAVEDAVTAELTQAITIDGRDVLPAGAQLTGVVTKVDGSGRVTGRAMVGFRFTSLRTGDEQYEVVAAPWSQLAPATRGEDATTIGIGAGAGAIIGGLLGGADGAAKGAAVGGGAGAGVVLATRGEEVRLEPGTDVSTELTAPFTVRILTD